MRFTNSALAMVIATLFLINSSSLTLASDRQIAMEVLAKNLSCPIPLQRSSRSGVTYTEQSENKYSGDTETLVIDVNWNSAEMAVGGEAYTQRGTNTITVDYREIASIQRLRQKSIKIACKASKSCIRIWYSMSDTGHDAEWKDHARRVSSVDIDLCDGNARNDAIEAIEFLSQ